ncbi:LysR family transcriptional regulator [Nocardia sp. CNY236]|uniref:LysR family transcriptional regulator n=1 Tax=Nocardia sp. CNY236 TaxID=1169152 RepID=UPI0004912D13
METLDMNLLVALDALLDTNSVTLAAQRLGSSPPAMSRALARLRRALGDPLLVRAGRTLAPTPRALELRSEVSVLVARGRALLAPNNATDPVGLRRTFAVQAGEGVLAELATPLLAAVQAQAPGVTVRFLPDVSGDTASLRDGRVDLEVGTLDYSDSETTVRRVLGDRMIGVAAAGHPLVTDPVTVGAYAAARHLSVSRDGRPHGPIDDRLALHGRTRKVVATVPTVTSALFAVRGSDLVCPVPAWLTATTLPALGLTPFEIPLPLPEIALGIAWHPRYTADGGHRWLRDLVHETMLRSAAGARPPI